MFEGPSNITPEPGPEPEKVVPSFEEQWGNPERVRIGTRVIEVEDIRPEQQTLEVPTIIGLGWSETPEAQKANIRTLVGKGVRVIAPDTPHGVEAEPMENYPTIELRKMAALIETLEARGVEKADIVAHSEGAIFSVMAAYMYPEKVRNLVLVNPAGMIGKDSLPRLAVGFSSDVVHHIINGLRGNAPKKEQESSARTLDMLGAVKEVLKNPVIQDPLSAIRSIFAIANADIRDMLVAIKKSGIGISVIHSGDDRAFPMDKMQEAIGIEHLDGFYATKGDHAFRLSDPRHALLVYEALRAQDQKSKNRAKSPEAVS